MNVLIKLKLVATLSVVSASVTIFGATWIFLNAYTTLNGTNPTGTGIIPEKENGSVETSTLERNLLLAVLRGSAIVSVTVSMQILASASLLAASKQEILSRWKFWTAFTCGTQIIALICILAPWSFHRQLRARAADLDPDIRDQAVIYYQCLGFYLAAHLLDLFAALLFMRVRDDFNYKSAGVETM